MKILIKRLFFGMAEGTFLYGCYAKKLMIDAGCNRKKIHVIYNSLKYTEHLNIRKYLKETNVYTEYYKNEYFNIIFMGRLTKQKQLDLLINSISVLSGYGLNCNLTLIGDGECRAELMTLVKELQLENQVWFYGACYQESMLAELIYNADICVSPGNVGLTAIHSMTFGTPVITHNNLPLQMPEFEVVVPAETGSFFDYGSYVSLANVIREWFSAGHDRCKIRKNCYNIIDEKWNPYFQLKIISDALYS